MADPPRLNSKSMKSLEIAGSGVAAAAAAGSIMSAPCASRLKDTRGLSHPYGAAAGGGRLLATAEAMDRGGGGYTRINKSAVLPALRLVLMRCRYGGSWTDPVAVALVGGEQRAESDVRDG